MAKYTVQFIVAGYAMPEGTDVEYYDSLEMIAFGLQCAHDQAESFGAAYAPSEAVIWKGELDDVTDVYPDRLATIGPRGGVRFDYA